MSQLKLKFLFLLLISSLSVKKCFAMDEEDENFDKKLQHAHSFFESIMASSVDSMFSDKNIFSRFKVNKEVDTIDVDTTIEDNENEKDNISSIDKENDFGAEAQTTINPSEPQPESLFNYHQVFREHYHNVQQKGDKQEGEDSNQVNMGLESSTQIAMIDSSKQDNGTTAIDTEQDNATTMISTIQDNGTTVIEEDQNYDSNNIIIKQKLDINDNDALQEDIHSQIAQEYGTNDEIDGRELGASKIIGPIDRSMKDDSDYIINEINTRDFQDGIGQPFRLRERDYFNSYFETSPSYDLRSSTFLREPEETEFVYPEKRMEKRADKHKVGIVIGALAGLGGFFAAKKLIFIFVGLATLLALGITGTGPMELLENMIPTVTTDVSVEATFDGNGDKTGSTVGVTVGGRSPKNDKMSTYGNLRKPITKLYNYLENSTISTLEPVVYTLQELNEFWTHFTKGFSSAIDLSDLDNSIREQRDGIYSMFPSFTSYPTEGLSMNGYTDAILSGFTSTREYIEGIIGDVVSAISEDPVNDLEGLESGSEVETESIKHLTAGSKSENHDIEESKSITMINNSPIGKLDPDEQLNSNDLEKNEAEYLRMNTDDSDKEIDPKEQPGYNELEQSNPKDFDLLSKEIVQEEQPRYTQPEQRNPRVFGFNNVDSNGEKTETKEFEISISLTRKNEADSEEESEDEKGKNKIKLRKLSGVVG